MKEGDKYVEFEDDDELAPPLPSLNHWHQFVDGVMGKGKTSAALITRPLTEAVLLGSIACKFPKTTSNGMLPHEVRPQGSTKLVERKYAKVRTLKVFNRLTERLPQHILKRSLSSELKDVS